MRTLTSTDFESFVRAKPAAAVHFDAAWDVAHKAITRQRMMEAEEALADRVNFGELDCDSNPELARSIPILNVPTVVYYRGGKLVAALIGADQDVRARLESLLRGESIGYTDGPGAPVVDPKH